MPQYEAYHLGLHCLNEKGQAIKTIIIFEKQKSRILPKISQEWNSNTVKLVLSGHSKIDKTKILMINGSLKKVESIAECPPWSILQYFCPA